MSLTLELGTRQCKNLASHLLGLQSTGSLPVSKGYPQDGCSELEDLSAEGRAVLFQRGSCEYATKAHYATVIRPLLETLLRTVIRMECTSTAFAASQAANQSLMIVVNNSTDCMIMGASSEAMANMSSIWAVSVTSDVRCLLSSHFC